MTPADLRELSILYAEETGLSAKVCAAFLAADREPPHAERVNAHGYSGEEMANVSGKQYEYATLDKPTEN